LFFQSKQGKYTYRIIPFIDVLGDNSYEDFELARMRSLEAFDPKFVTAHINANFSTTDLDAESTTKSTSINAFSYAPQNNKSKTLKKQADIQAHQNESLFNINEKDKKETSAYIEGIGQIESNEDVISACANICGIMFAIVNTTGDKKPILHQAMMKIILFIRERSTSGWMRDNKKDCAHLPYGLGFPKTLSTSGRSKATIQTSRQVISPSPSRASRPSWPT
jgi:hypothetical protein